MKQEARIEAIAIVPASLDSGLRQNDESQIFI